MIKKWSPFIILMLIIVINLFYFFFSKEKSIYTPVTDDAATIYREACVHCHGNRGQGSGFFYPAFEDNILECEIRRIITKGGLLMPAFIKIKGDTLENLIKFIHSGSYKE